MKEIRLGVTGHRPTNKEQYEDAALNKLTVIIVDELVKLQQQYVITELRSGMALWFDTGCCLAAIHLNIPFIAEVPLNGISNINYVTLICYLKRKKLFM